MVLLYYPGKVILLEEIMKKTTLTSTVVLLALSFNTYAAEEGKAPSGADHGIAYCPSTGKWETEEEAIKIFFQIAKAAGMSDKPVPKHPSGVPMTPGKPQKR